MHQGKGRVTAAMAVTALVLWPLAAAVTIETMRQLPSNPARSSLILADLWLLIGAMTATLCFAILHALERNRRVFYDYGYLCALQDVKADTVGAQRPLPRPR